MVHNGLCCKKQSRVGAVGFLVKSISPHSWCRNLRSFKLGGNCIADHQLVAIAPFLRRSAPSMIPSEFPLRYEPTKNIFFSSINQLIVVVKYCFYCLFTKSWFYIKHIIFPVNARTFTASLTCILKSTILEITCNIAVLTVRTARRTISGLLSFNTIVGAIEEIRTFSLPLMELRI